MGNSIINDSFIQRLEAITFNMKTNMRGYFGGIHKTNSYGSTVEFADFREYVLGDDIRRIDWNMYSRFEKFFIKLFTDERQMHIQILIDCSSSMNYKDSQKRVFALQVAAAMGYLAIQNMDKVSIKLIHGDRCDDLCGVVAGKSSFLRAVSQLEQVEFGGTAVFDKAITSDLNPGQNDGLTILISDFLTETNWKNAVDYLLYKKREIMLVHVLDEEEIKPSYSGRSILLDGEAEDRYDQRNIQLAITRSEYEAYRMALKDYLADIKTFCSKRNITYVYSKSSETVEKILLEKLYLAEVIK